MTTAKVIQVIQVNSVRGNGTDERPYRSITEYFSVEGEKLAEFDPCLHECRSEKGESQ